ncbi:MAG: ABC transporter ATP-binding protein [Bdellovibrionales bacterium]|nr:ABC transporter ATP-binding protein [Bdellovibrionales bacterium]
MMLQAESLKKGFQQGGQEILAVNDVSFSVNKGETVAIVGPSGSGKTTLLSLLAGLENSDSGQVTIDGKVITGLGEAELTRYRGEKIGIVFQQFHLMPHLTALENVSLPLDIAGEDQVRDKALKALKNVGLENRATHLPSQLSGGECQRVAIARATVIQPAVLFADEPSGNLDTETGGRVTDILFELVKTTQMTMILVTHDMELAGKCDRILSIRGGLLQNSN